MRTLSAPVSISWGITSKCNLRCKHCFCKEDAIGRDLTLDGLLRVARQIKRLNVFSIGLFGGEPLLCKDLPALLSELSGSPASITLSTNGTNLSYSTAKMLSGFNISQHRVSIDGSCGRIHDALRGEGSFKKALAGIMNLIKQGLNVSFSTTISRHNYRDVSKIVELGKRIGVDHVRLNELVCFGDFGAGSRGLRMTVKEWQDLMAMIKALKNKFGNFVQGSMPFFQAVTDGQFSTEKISWPRKAISCLAGKTKCAIRPDGWVIPCVFLWGEKAGNVRKKDLSRIWNESKAIKNCHKGIMFKKEYGPECSLCKMADLCYSGFRCWNRQAAYGKALAGHKGNVICPIGT